MADHRTDRELVEAVRAGDASAYAVLFDRYADRCFDVARRIVHDDGRAADVTQEVFTVAWRQLGRLRDPGAFGGWVLRASRNRALNARRDEGRAVATDGADASLRDLAAPTSVEADVAARDHQDLVWAAAAALGERDASVLDLHLRHHLSVPEIAEELGITTNNAHQVLHRMKERLGAGIRAYVLVRGGDAACPELRSDLAAAGVARFGPDAVKVIGRHVGRCPGCEGRQAAVLAPEAMFSAVPVLVMGPALRARAAAGLEGLAGSGPHAKRAPRPGRGRAVLVGGVAAAVVAALVVGLLLGRGGDTDEAGADDPTTVAAGPDEAATTDEPAPTTEPAPTDPLTTDPVTTDPGAASGALEGAWVADAADILAANTAGVGGSGGLACSGPITMTFAADGTFDRGGTVSCTVAGTTAEGTVSTTGQYTYEGGRLVVSGTTSTGRMSLGGTEVPTPDSFGDGTAEVEVAGDTLALTFTDTAVGTVTQTYRRA